VIDSVAANRPESTWRGAANQKRKSKLNHEGDDPRREFTAEALRAWSTEFWIKKILRSLRTRRLCGELSLTALVAARPVLGSLW